MHRRSLLAALAGVASAGSLAALLPGRGEATAGTPDARHVEVPGSPVAALAADAVPDDVPLQHGVTIHGQPAPDEPVHLTETITNADDRAHTLYAATRTRPNAALVDTPPVHDRLVLHPGERATYTYALDVRGGARDQYPFASRFVLDRGDGSVSYRWGFSVETE